MNTKLIHIGLIAGVVATASMPANAGENRGFFNALAANANLRSEIASEHTESRLRRTGDAVARHLEQHPGDIRHVDDIAKLIAADTARSVEDGARVVVGGVVADSFRSFFQAFEATE